MSYKFILDGHKVVPCYDLHQWGCWMEKNSRRVAENYIGDVRVSTVFLGSDHGSARDNKPIVFETMVFGGKNDQDMERYATWEEAEEGHRKMCNKCILGR